MSLSNSIAEGLTRWSQEIGDLGGAKGGSGRSGAGGNEILLTPLEVGRIRLMIDGAERGRCFLMTSVASSGQVAKKPLSMDLQKGDLAARGSQRWHEGRLLRWGERVGGRRCWLDATKAEVGEEVVGWKAR